MTEQATLTTETTETLLSTPETVTETPAPVTPEPPAPAEYAATDFADITADDIDPAMFEEYLAQSKENGMTKAQVETQLKKGKELRDRVIQAQFQKVEQTKSEWLKATQNDPEIGGDKINDTLAVASLAMKEVSPEFRQVLNSTGLGNHPELIKVFYKLGLTLKQDGVIPGTPARAEKSLADRFYGK